MKPELNLSKLEDVDKAYLAGLFDGEGCISPTWNSKKRFSIREQREKRSFCPRLQFVISNKNHLLIELIKSMIGFGRMYREGEIYNLRISAQRQILNIVNALIPHVKLKKEALYISRDAVSYQLKRKLRSKWTSEEKTFFYNKFMLPLLKLLPPGKKRGRPSKYSLNEILSDP